MPSFRVPFAIVAAWFIACGPCSQPGPDAGTPDAGGSGAGADAGEAIDAGDVPDAGDGIDAGESVDAGDVPDAGDPEPRGPVLDTQYTTSEVIDHEGGYLELALGTSGITVDLSLSEGALLEPTTVTLTSITGLDPWPFESPLLAGVDIGPDGTELNEGAWLGFYLPEAVDPGSIVGFGYRDDGDDLEILPLVRDDGAVFLVVTHFSGYGIARLTNAELTAVRAGASTASAIALQSIARAQLATPTDTAAQTAAARTWYDDAVKPALVAAAADATQAEGALRQWLAWRTVVQSYGIGGLSTQESESEGLAGEVLSSAFDDANATCSRTGTPADVRAAVRWLALAQSLGLDQSRFGLDTANGLARLCLRLVLTASNTNPAQGTAVTLTAALRVGDGPPAADWSGRRMTFQRSGPGTLSPITATTAETGSATTTFTAPSIDADTTITAALDVGVPIPLTAAVAITTGSGEPEYSESLVITRLQPRESLSDLVISGAFIDDPSAGERRVTIGTTAVDVSSWSSSEIVVSLPPGAFGPVMVRVGDAVGRPRWLTQWSGTVTVSEVSVQTGEIAGTVTRSGSAQVRFRASLQQPWPGFSATADSTFSLAVSGSHSGSDAVITFSSANVANLSWDFTGQVDVVPRRPIITRFLVNAAAGQRMQSTPRDPERAEYAWTQVDPLGVLCENLDLGAGATGTQKVETFTSEGFNVFVTTTRTCTASAVSAQGLPPEE